MASDDGFDRARARWMDRLEARIAEAIADDTLLGPMLAYHFSTGGKRIRALLPPWVCDELGGDGASALDLGAGLEILHNATLIHDDIQDGDALRRGAPTVWSRWGVAQGINTGDSLFFLGLGLVARAPAGPGLLGPVCDALQEVVRGQVMEFQLQRPPGDPEGLAPSWAHFRAMAEAKTGALFGACLMSGAAAAGADDAQRAAFYRFGLSIGLLFQVQDDYLDLVGEKGRELRGADLAEGKLSFPVVWALEHAPPETSAALMEILRLPRAQTTPADVGRALGMLDRCGALAATAAWLRARRDEALADPCAQRLPGLIDRFLAPVVHAL